MKRTHNTIGRFLRVTQYETIVAPPLIKPAARTPGTARPTISIFELWGTAQITDPSSEMSSSAMYDHRMS
ncbi:uncharacterized protein N7503_001916 [Penicillium pulvis]|uniref:uncharacterized protein n=1 Tax=Penicillium pulvis TaxID=1562058 RepID=UPI0025478388|nr:uncharacterized protein N7503_001916 [Penicillium pulvis]KAJ5809698.1 hypothetical protein N7503_001916 [Penicillium pulvis]